MTKTIKIQSHQGGGFNAQKNLIDFSYGSGGETFDLSRSYVNLMSQCVVTGGNADAIYNCRQLYSFGGANLDLAVQPVTIVKNCDLKCAKVGALENIRRVDCLRTNLKPLSQTVEEFNSELYKGAQTFTRSQASYSPWRELKGEGSVKSRNLVAPLQIPLSDLFELGNSVVNCSKLGEMRMHLELNADRFANAVQTPKAGEVVGDKSYQLFNDILEADQTDITFLTTKHVFTRMQDCPYWTGMQLNISTVGADGAADIDVDAIITSIEHLQTGADAGRVKITFDQQLGNTLTAGQSQTAIVINPVNATAVSFQIDYAELVLEIVDDTPMDDLNYSTFTLEETNGNGLLDFQEQFSIEEGAFNLIAFPVQPANDLLAGVGAGTVISNRWIIDNKEATNRDVKINSPLYYDRLAMTLLNDAKNVKSLVLSVPSSSQKSNPVRWTNHSVSGLIYQPVPITTTRKSVNIQLRTTAGCQKVMVYKQVAKSFAL